MSAQGNRHSLLCHSGGKDFTVKDIDRWHRERGWDGAGYHFVVLGKMQTGRPIEKIGTHTKGYNTDSIGICYTGICYIGGLAADGTTTAKDTRTSEQKTVLMALCKDLLKSYPSIKKISGHKKYTAKIYLSFNVQNNPLPTLIDRYQSNHHSCYGLGDTRNITVDLND